MQPSVVLKTSAPAKRLYRGSITRPARSLVPASPRQLPEHRAGVASGCWPSFTGHDWLPAGQL